MKNTILSVTAFAVICISPVFGQETMQSLTVDSTLIVGDSATFNSAVRVAEKMTIEGTTLLMEEAVAEKDLRVEGNLYLPNIPETVELRDILFVDGSGMTHRGGIPALIDHIYSKECSTINGVIQSPSWANGPNKLFVGCPEVKVGIGTTEPTHNLTNMGNTKFYGHTFLASTLSLGADYDAFAKFYIKNPTGGAAIQIDNSGNTGQFQKLLYFKYSEPSTEIIKVTNSTANYNPFVLTAAGSMIINNGTTNTFELAPDGKLVIRNATQKNFQFEVNGTFRARRIRVDADSWADFVFEPEYQLMPLTEVKEYVNVNKHLPGVPSEQEITENGIDLAEMNKILVQKIEELMLHLIDQNDQTAVLKAEVEALKAKIAALEATK